MIVYRNQQTTFTGRFFEDPAQTIPIVPFDASKSPTYAIYDPNNLSIASGIGIATMNPGIYDAQWTVPSDAELTTPSSLWKIQWVMVSASGRQLIVDEKFEVREYEHTGEVDLGFSSVTLPGMSHRIYTTFIQEVTALKLTIAQASTPDTILFTVDSAVTPIHRIPEDGAAPLAGSINRYVEGGTHVYFFDTDQADVQAVGDYQAIWFSQVTPLSPVIIDPKYYSAINRLWLNFYPDIRLFIDKIRKRFGTVQAYYDGDLYRCLTLGIQTLGQYHPNNLQFDISTFPDVMRPHLVMAAAFWALKSQQTLELDLSFSFCLDEEMLVRTDRGLVKAKHLEKGVNQKQLAFSSLILPEDREIFEAIYTHMPSGAFRTQEIVEACGLGLGPMALGMRFSKYGLSDMARKTDHKGGWLWDTSAFWSILEDVGVFKASDEESVQIPCSYNVCLGSETKTPKFLWDLGRRLVWNVRTDLGYETRCTKGHGFLVLDTVTLKTEWRKLQDMQEGDLVGIDAHGESERFWEVEFDADIPGTNAANTPYNLPKRLTKPLSRILGFLVADGWATQYNIFSFTNTSQKLIDRYMEDFYDTFGVEPEVHDAIDVEGSYSYDPSIGPKKSDVMHIIGSGVRLRRFMASVGLGYWGSREKEIPWCILQAPLSFAAEFLRSYFDGDGCWSENSIIFSSFSKTLRSQLQTLLLRFGIVSRNSGCNVTVRGPSLRRYIDQIGFQYKGGPCTLSKFYTQREAIPSSVFETIRNIRSLLPNVGPCGWHTDASGKKQRVQLHWDHGDHYAKYTTWDHVQKWWDDGRSDVVKRLRPDLFESIDFLLRTRYLWKPVTDISAHGKVRVLDPCLPEGCELLSPGFTASGFVNHNSGQTTSLDYDHFGSLDGLAQNMRDWLDSNVPMTKMGLFRRRSAVAKLSTRPVDYQFRSMAYKIHTGPPLSTGYGILQMIGSFGLL